jgi:hypothetical protein
MLYGIGVSSGVTIKCKGSISATNVYRRSTTTGGRNGTIVSTLRIAIATQRNPDAYNDCENEESGA